MMKNPSKWIPYLKHPMVLVGFALLAIVGLLKAVYVDNTIEWIKHLQHPVVLIGFALFILSLFLKPVFAHRDKLSEVASEHLMHKAINLLFVLAFFVALLGFILSFQQNITIEEASNDSKYPQKITNYGEIGVQNNAKGDINIYQGMSEQQIIKLKQYKESLVKEQKIFIQQQANLIQQQAEIISNKQQLPNNEVRKKLAAVQEKLSQSQDKLVVIQDKLFNLKASYEKEIRLRKEAEKALNQFKGQLPEAQIKTAQASLKEGDKAAAEKAFDNIVNNHSGDIALAAFQSGQLAEDRIDYAKAIKQYTKAVVLAEDNPAYLLVAGQMAITVADYPQAQKWLEQLLKLRKAEKKQDTDLATAQHALARVYEAQGAYAKAEPLFLRSLSIMEKALGKSHPSVATSLNNLASLYESQGAVAKAEPLYLRSLDIKEKALGKSHPSVATTLNNLAGLYKSQGAYAKAEPLYLRSLSILRAAFPNGHPNIEGIQGNYDDLKEKMKQ